MIDISKIRPTYEGQYLLPSLTYGWNDELISALNANKVAPKPLDQYFDYWGIFDYWGMQIPKRVKDRCKNTPHGREIIKDLLIGSGAKVLGIGNSVEKAVANATRKLNYEFKHIMPGQFANFPAYKWTYLQPDYLVLEQITLPDRSNVCLILQIG